MTEDQLQGFVTFVQAGYLRANKAWANIWCYPQVGPAAAFEQKGPVTTVHMTVNKAKNCLE